MTRQLFEVIKFLYCLLVTTQLLIIFFWIGFWFILPSFRIPLSNTEPKGPYSVQHRLIWERGEVASVVNEERHNTFVFH